MSSREERSSRDVMSACPALLPSFIPLYLRVGVRFRVQGPGSRVQGSGSRVQGPGFRVQGAGCRVQGAGCMVQGCACAACTLSSRTCEDQVLDEPASVSAVERIRHM